MARVFRILAGLAVLCGVGWGSLWMFARSDFETGVEQTIGAMRAAGYEVEIGAQSVTGFPFALTAVLEDVELRDPVSGHAARLPRLESELNVAAPGAVVTRLPERFVVEIPVGPALASALHGLGARARIEVRAEDLVVTASGADPYSSADARGGRLSISGKAVSLTPAEAIATLDYRVDFTGLAARLDPSGSDTPSRLTVNVAKADVSSRVSSGGMARALSLTLSGPALEAGSTARSLPALERILFGAPEGRAMATLRLEEAVVRLEVSGAGTTEDGTLDIALGDVSVGNSFEGGSLNAEASLGTLGAVLAPADPTSAPGGGIASGPIAMALEAPAGPSEAMRRLHVTARLDGLAPDAQLWSALDPDEALPRAPLALDLTLDGSARFTADPHRTVPGAAPPVELGNVSLKAFSLRGLGAEARATGDVEFLQPIQQPHGRIALELEGVLGLIRALHRAALIDEQTVQTLATFAAFYTRAGEGPDHLRVDLGLDGRGLTVNGEPFEPIR